MLCQKVSHGRHCYALLMQIKTKIEDSFLHVPRQHVVTCSSPITEMYATPCTAPVTNWRHPLSPFLKKETARQTETSLGSKNRQKQKENIRHAKNKIFIMVLILHLF